MKTNLPENCLVLLLGASGSGKSTFAAKHFLSTEVVSSDYCRAVVSDDDNNQSVTGDAFDLLHFVVSKRMKNRRLTVVDATNVQPESRKKLIDLADSHYYQTVGIVFNFDIDVSFKRNQNRPERQFGRHVVAGHVRDLRRSLKSLKREGFRSLTFFNEPSQVDQFEGFERIPMWTDRNHDSGPFDIVGDVHGCLTELIDLCKELGYQVKENDLQAPVELKHREKPESVAKPTDPEVSSFPAYYSVTHPENRKLIFLGDLIDRGPDSVGVLKFVISAVKTGGALVVPGNHDEKLYRKIRGQSVSDNHGFGETWAQMQQQSPEFHEAFRWYYDSLPGHLVLDSKRLAVAHAGLHESMIGLAHRRIRDFVLYGETTGEIDEFGLPVRYPWALDYRGKTSVVYGHTPVPEAEWLNETIDIDTGCCFGGKLTALRWPEKELVSVDAIETYAIPSKPLFVEPSLSAQHEHDDLLDISDTLKRMHVMTRDRGTVIIREENASAALEVMSRFAANPKWLIYLPPTMSPVETSNEPGFLERPEQAFEYFQHERVEKVVCEEKHMGSRAVVIACKDESVASRRFGVEGECGIVYTRTGRRFFDNRELEQQFIQRVYQAFEETGVLKELQTDWIALDCELMPWSAKAQGLIREQYEPVGISANIALSQSENFLRQAGHSEVADRISNRLNNAQKYQSAYQVYCWQVDSLDDYRLAPFHILATEGNSHLNKDHGWHMTQISQACSTDDPILFATPHRFIDLDDESQVKQAIEWWESLVTKGGEGMVVKPFDFTHRGPRGLVQPALKVRGPEYLRIIYGPDYLMEENISRLRKRGLKTKRSLAQREFALGKEALDRFVEKRPLRYVHECVFAVLALESEPVDPRL